MNVRVYNTETFPQGAIKGKGKSGNSFLSMYKTGHFVFNRHSVAKTGLKYLDFISIAQDEDNPNNWYLFKSENGFMLSSINSNKGLQFSHKDLQRQICKAFGADDSKPLRLVIGSPTEVGGVQYWPLIYIKKD